MSLFDDRQLLLAPMAGVNDPVFRALCRRMGASLTYTEMISSMGLAHRNAKTQKMIAALPEDIPYAVQLFGSEPEVMAAEARSVAKRLGNTLALIDINMGCPARKVATGGSGAALLQKPCVALNIIEAVCKAVCLPVTVKMRLLSSVGGDDTLAFAKRVQEAGAAAITLHGRTAEQGYKGVAERETVARLASELDIPVVASGDVFTPEDIQDYFRRGVSAVMVARGAQGNPWMFAGYEPSMEERIALAREHTQRLYEWDPHKLVWMRKHLAWYFKGTPTAVRIRTAVQRAVVVEDYLAILEGHA